VDDTRLVSYDGVVPPHGSYGLPDLGPMATSVLRASACCIEIHKRLHNFATGVDDVRLCLHIGVGCGEITILQVGGVVPPETHVPRLEYLIAGPPLEQISVAEPLAKNGETCLSPQAWDLVKDCVTEGAPIEENPDFHLLKSMVETKYTFPTIKYATRLYDMRHKKTFQLEQLNMIRRYVPSAVFKQIECGTLPYVNEMRNVSVVFISGSGLDVSSAGGPQRAQELMVEVQKTCYAHEGTLNKFLIDDKGMLFLLVFGLPPLVHPDDPTRATLCCMELTEVFRRLKLVGRFGVTTGRCYCGVCGSAKRMEYTVLGDCANLSARLMSNATELGVLCDEETSKYSTGEIEFEELPRIKVKGKENPIPIFKPKARDWIEPSGLTREATIRFPWYDHPIDGAMINVPDIVKESKTKVIELCSVTRWEGIVKVSEMLGSGFNKSLHQSTPVIPAGSRPKAKAPVGSPFADGGMVVLEGQSGLGKVELAEHMITHCATQFNMMPVFGTMGPRPGEVTRIVLDLLRSTLAVFRHLDRSVPDDDAQALAKVMPEKQAASLPKLQELLKSKASTSPGNGAKTSDDRAVFDLGVKCVIELLKSLSKKTPILVVLLFANGTSLFDKTTAADLKVFWNLTEEMCKLVKDDSQIAGLVVCKHSLDSSPAVQHAKEHNSHLSLKGLNEDSFVEQYISNHLTVPAQGIPTPLREFVSQVTLGNPLYIRETLLQLQNDGHIKVKKNVSVDLTSTFDVQNVDIASWNHTQMVGSTTCILESLEPIEASALKMSTCFENPYTLPDLAASNCSQWGGATHFDLLRLFRATQRLVQLDLVQEVAAPSNSLVEDNNDVNSTPKKSVDKMESVYGMTQYYQMKGLLVKTVGAAMVLEAQKKSVKRNALIDRVLKQDLPDRMRELQEKKSVVHIPWYYERALRRMQ
jgi:class 3 adenylate cyclase